MLALVAVLATGGSGAVFRVAAAGPIACESLSQVPLANGTLLSAESIPAGRVRRESARVVTDIAAAARLPEQNRPPDQTRRSHRRVGIATDHAGFERKDELIAYLHDAGHEVVDVGAYSPNPGDDYPDFVIPLAEAVAAGRVDRGIAVCGSGVGASVCANKVPGIRAGLVDDHFSARQGVEDDNMNILCMSGRAVGPAVAREFLDAFLTAEFSGAERHVRRLRKIAALERQSGQSVLR